MSLSAEWEAMDLENFIHAYIGDPAFNVMEQSGIFSSLCEQLRHRSLTDAADEEYIVETIDAAIRLCCPLTRHDVLDLMATLSDIQDVYGVLDSYGLAEVVISECVDKNVTTEAMCNLLEQALALCADAELSKETPSFDPVDDEERAEPVY